MEFKFMNKEDRENIKIINEYMGTKHRTKPYDFNNPDDIIEATILVTAEYTDIAHYWRTLTNLEVMATRYIFL